MKNFVLCFLILFAVNRIEAQDSLNITQLSAFEVGGMDLELVDNYLFLAGHRDGLFIMDVSDPASPVLAGNYPSPSLTEAVDFSDDRLYLACWDSGMVVLDASDRENLHEIGRYPSGDTSWDIEVRDTIVFLGDYAAGLKILNVANPESIWEVGNYSPRPVASFLTLMGDYLFVSTLFNNLKTVDVSDLAEPREINSIRSTFPFRVVGILPLIYIADGNSGVRMVDLTNPFLPRVLSIFDTQGSATDVGLLGDLIVVAGEANGGLLIVDFSDPESPVTVGYHSAAVAKVLIGDDGLIYTNQGIFRYTPGESVRDDEFDHPGTFILSAPYPNPFNSSTTLSFSLDRAAPTSLEVFDPLGRRIEKLIPIKTLRAGKHSVVWNGAGAHAGEYFIRLQSGGRVEAIPVTFVK